MDMQEERTANAVKVMTDFVNNYGHDPKEFAKMMEREHRTLQQSFTKLCLKWIEHIAQEEYRTDGRNEDSKKTAQKLLQGWELLRKEDETKTYGFKPSEWLHLI